MTHIAKCLLMTQCIVVWLLLLYGPPLTSAVFAQQTAEGTKEAENEPEWTRPSIADVRRQVMDFVIEHDETESVRAKAEAIWKAHLDTEDEEVSEDQVLSALAETLALVDSDAATLIATCSGPSESSRLVPPPWLRDESLPSLLTANLRLLYARWLVHGGFLDEAGEQLVGIQPTDVVAPCVLLFYQSIVHHGLLQKEQGLATIERLLAVEDQSPRRYAALARLMQRDLDGLEDDSLDHIARRMGDIQRRLDLGRAGPKVRQVEDGVIDSLDKLIEKLEEKQKNQSDKPRNGTQSNTPASDSRIMGGQGAGDVTSRSIGGAAGWGDLPPKEREETLQQMGRDFPAHYREVIEQYFRRLAGQNEN